ncbi:MAG: peptidoglycan-binding domain-containing protein [Pseudomonadota bacterium]
MSDQDLSENVTRQKPASGEWLITFGTTGFLSVFLTVFVLNNVEHVPSGLDQVIGEGQVMWPIESEVLAMEPNLDNPFALDMSLYAAVPSDVIEAESHGNASAETALAEPELADPRLPAMARLQVPLRTPSADDVPAVADAADPAAQRAAPARIVFADTTVAHVALRAPTRPEDRLSAELEEQLALNRSQRAVIQRRLILAGYDPQGVDGIFGEGTRAALAEMQQAKGFTPTGYLDTATLESLNEATDADYAVWRAQRAADRKRRAQFAKVEVPPQRPNAPTKRGRCARDAEGRIIGYQGFVCDISGLGEALISFDLPKADGGDERLADARTRNDR